MLSWLFSDPLPVGSPAPDFELPDDAGNAVSLSGLRGRNVLLVFYPGDDTPGCTRQLCRLRDEWEELRARGVQVYGVNPQDARHHQRFRNKFHLPFPLLVDDAQKVARQYHANGLIVKRTVYLVDAKGVIRFAARGMPEPREVLEALE
jgi:thioredoxin-dependent peroxiredoxin